MLWLFHETPICYDTTLSGKYLKDIKINTIYLKDIKINTIDIS